MPIGCAPRRLGAAPDSHPAAQPLTATSDFLAVGTAIAAGLLIGIERGWNLRRVATGRRVAGVRTFTLERDDGGPTRFRMREEYTGPLLPLIWRSLPDLGPSFEQFARGLKARAEERR